MLQVIAFTLVAAFGQDPLDILTDHTLLELNEQGDLSTSIEKEDVEAWHSALWTKYLTESADPSRREEHETSKIRVGDKTMRYEAFIRGATGKNGRPLFIAMHGGGGAPARVNDSQWDHMKVYYRESVESGVYVATRGVTDTWNLHWVPESFVMYDRLIENMILFEGVDPNRVYIMGFSAGGDGVYQLAPRMADRWAAASMSAGHPNGVSPLNLHHCPLLLQVGQNDAAYGRNKIAVDYANQVASLKREQPLGYIHDIFVHAGKGHNFRDNDPKQTRQAVLKDPNDVESENARSVEINTNSAAWLIAHTRNPTPETVTWDLNTGANRRNAIWQVQGRGDRSYWLGVPEGTAKAGNIVASFERETNRIEMKLTADSCFVLLNERMINFDAPVTLTLNESEFQVELKPSLALMIQTLLERGDLNFMFDAALSIQRINGEYDVSPLLKLH